MSAGHGRRSSGPADDGNDTGSAAQTNESVQSPEVVRQRNVSDWIPLPFDFGPRQFLSVDQLVDPHVVALREALEPSNGGVVG